jgi:hypothetical protein
MVGTPPDARALLPKMDTPTGPIVLVAATPWHFSLRFVDATDSRVRRSPPPARAKQPALR